MAGPTEESFSVSLITHTPNPEEVVARACLVCYSSRELGVQDKSLTPETVRKVIEKVVSRGHTSVLEHAYFTFAIEGISRACSHQLVRHRMASYSQQSQRFVDLEGFSYVLPEKIRDNEELKRDFRDKIVEVHELYKRMREAGIPKEDARFILPNASTTKIIMTMNARSLLNLFLLRTCNRAQWEIRELARRILCLVRDVCPVIFEGAGPSCRVDRCREGDMSCGNPPVFPWEKDDEK